MTQKQRAYDYLREKLIAGELSPGSRLSDIALAKEIGISRTPIREAINQLANEDLVQLVPHNGAFVKVPDEEELIELYDLRKLLETYAVKQAAGNMSEGNLRQLIEMITHMDMIIKELKNSGREAPTAAIRRRWVMTDYAFHLVLFKSCGNRKVMRIASDLRMLTQAFIFRKEDPKISPIEVMRIANKEHREVFRALESGKGDEASEVIDRHLDRAKNATLANYATVCQSTPEQEPEWLTSVRGVINNA